MATSIAAILRYIGVLAFLGLVGMRFPDVVRKSFEIKGADAERIVKLLHQDPGIKFSWKLKWHGEGFDRKTHASTRYLSETIFEYEPSQPGGSAPVIRIKGAVLDNETGGRSPVPQYEITSDFLPTKAQHAELSGWSSLLGKLEPAYKNQVPNHASFNHRWVDRFNEEFENDKLRFEVNVSATKSYVNDWLIGYGYKEGLSSEGHEKKVDGVRASIGIDLRSKAHRTSAQKHYDKWRKKMQEEGLDG